MSFVMFAGGAASRARVRTVPLRLLLPLLGASALGLVSMGAVAGYWMGAAPPSSRAAATSVAAPTLVPAPATASIPALPFTIEQLGALSGRLFTLESQAAQLSRRIGLLPRTSPTPPPADAAKPGSGGPLLPPRAEATGLQALAGRLERLQDQIARVAEAAAERNLDVMRMPTRLPVAGAELVSRFGNRQDPLANHKAFHAGLDFAAPQGSPIRSAAAGMVAFAGFRTDFGWVVDIVHGNGLTTRYAHASKLLVRSGELVTPGETIAMVGSTGRSTGPHLHFEVLRNGEHVDPGRYLFAR